MFRTGTPKVPRFRADMSQTKLARRKFSVRLKQGKLKRTNQREIFNEKFWEVSQPLMTVSPMHTAVSFSSFQPVIQAALDVQPPYRVRLAACKFLRLHHLKLWRLKDAVAYVFWETSVDEDM